MGKVAKHRRQEMWIATKATDRSRDGARRQLEGSLTRLQTDYGPERLAFFREMLPLVTPQNVPWKAADWNHPVEWKPRAEPALSRAEGPPTV